MPEHTEFSRSLLLAVDMWRYGSRDGQQQADLQQALTDGVTTAATAAGLDRASWTLQDGGDGFCAVITDSSAEPVLVGPFVRELDTWLHRFNHVRRPETQLRLRLATHHGGSVPAAHGYASDGLVHVNRLLDAAQARAVLTALPEANLVQILSEPIFEGCVRQRLTEVFEAEFVRIRVDIPAKAFRSDAWIRVPGVPAEKVAELAGREPLVVGIRLSKAAQTGPDFADRVLRPSLAAAGISCSRTVDEDCRDLALSLPAGTPGERVLGVWLHHLADALDAHAPELQVAVGVAEGHDLAAARDLAEEAEVRGFLDGVADGPIVVVVSAEVHRRIVDGSVARMVMPDSYRSLATDPETWVRVLGYSVPPEPAPRREDVAAPLTSPGIGVVNGPVSNIESGIFHGPFVVGSWHDNRGTGR
ncbi:hypothetical protein OHS18_24465 [Amycolatopsis sp. NBC_00355]|uniref:hypothetical protein n=1 Tax=Amycolatopsis sp. NBC_00355 TaxID=2975957 RepID=UPI002E269460